MGESNLPLVFMRLLFILLVFVSGCALNYYPKGQIGRKIEYFSSGVNEKYCSLCGKSTYLYKRYGKDKIMCPDCFEIKIIKIRRK